MENTVFSGKDLLKAVELMISKQDLRNQPKLCMQMLQYFGFTEKEVAETLREGKYVDFTRRGALGLVKIPGCGR